MDNFLSYYFVDEFLWLGTSGFINEFREEVRARRTRCRRSRGG
jgi:hypothetical protein